MTDPTQTLRHRLDAETYADYYSESGKLIERQIRKYQATTYDMETDIGVYCQDNRDQQGLDSEKSQEFLHAFSSRYW